MKYTRLLTALAASALLTACAQSLAVSNKETFAPQKTGVIGVFRQPVGFCSGGYKQQVTLGGEKILVKPTWTTNQDNLFSAYIKPGNADFGEYVFSCGFTQTTVSSQWRRGVVIPENGFCKITMSFLKGDELFSQNDSLLREFFTNENVAVPFDDIPYCKTY